MGKMMVTRIVNYNLERTDPRMCRACPRYGRWGIGEKNWKYTGGDGTGSLGDGQCLRDCRGERTEQEFLVS